MARLDAWLGTPRRRGSDQPHTEPEDVVSEMEAQARICPTCHDDHRETQPCTLPAELDGEVVAVVQAAVKAAVRNIPGHVSDRAAEGIARAALHAFTPRLAVLLREAEARGAAREPAAAPRCEHDDPSGYVGRCRPCGADARSMPCDECGAPSTHVATPGGFRFCDDHGPQR
jgi:hypothetical protein